MKRNSTKERMKERGVRICKMRRKGKIDRREGVKRRKKREQNI